MNTKYLETNKLSCSVFNKQNNNFKQKIIIKNQLEIISFQQKHFSNFSKNYNKAYYFLMNNNIEKALHFLPIKKLDNDLFSARTRNKLCEATNDLILYADIQVLLNNPDEAKNIYDKLIIVNDSKEIEFKYVLFYDLILGDSVKSYKIYKKLKTEIFKNKKINAFIDLRLAEYWIEKKLFKIAKFNIYKALKNSKQNILIHTQTINFSISKLHTSLFESKNGDFNSNLKDAIAFCAKAIKTINRTNAQTTDIHEKNINDFSKAKMLLHLSKLLSLYLELNHPLSEIFSKRKIETEKKYSVTIEETEYYDEFFMEVSYSNITKFSTEAITILKRLTQTYNNFEIESEYGMAIAKTVKHIHNYNLDIESFPMMKEYISSANIIIKKRENLPFANQLKLTMDNLNYS